MPTISLNLTDKQMQRLTEATDAYNAHFESSLTPKQFVSQFVIGTIKNWLMAASRDSQQDTMERELNDDLK